MKTKVNYFAILTFYSIAISLRYLTNKTELINGISSEFIKVLLQGIGPAIGALVAFTVFKIKPILSIKGNYKKVIVPFLLFWMFPIVLILSVEYFIKGSISYQAVFAILMYGLLEEIGWRGFLQQELKALPQFLNILIVATLWFIWHLNFDITSSNLLFFGILLLGTWGIGKVADSTQSLLAISAFHSLNNFFPEMNQTKIIILATLLIVWVTALVIKKRQIDKKNIS